jgi:hypothetical protein
VGTVADRVAYTDEQGEGVHLISSGGSRNCWGTEGTATTFGELAHQVEHLLCKQKVKGSSPLLSTTKQ